MYIISFHAQVGIAIIPTEQSLREVKAFAQGHTASKGYHCDSSPVCLLQNIRLNHAALADVSFVITDAIKDRIPEPAGQRGR